MSQECPSSRGHAPFSYVLVFLAFALVGFLLYGHTLQAPFYLDDIINIRDKLCPIESLSLRSILHCGFESLARYRPLANISFGLNYYFHGYEVSGYHLVNIVIHITNGILLYLFVFKTITLPSQRHTRLHPGWIAMLASLLWFVNPLQIQSVTYIIQRMTSMATLFFLSSFLCYLYGRLSSNGPMRVSLFVFSALAWMLSMASKQIGLTLPALVFVYEWFFFQNLNKVWLKRAGFFLLIGIGGLLAAVYFMYHRSPLSFVTAISQPREYTALERFLTQGRIIFLYISLLLYPHPARLTLSHDISLSSGLLQPLTTLASFAGLLALAVLAALLAKRWRIIAFSIIWFLVNLAIEALAASIEPMFEHRVYLPSMLLFLPFVWLAFRGLHKPSMVIPTVTACILVFSFWTYQRNSLWNDPVAFWKDAVQKSPNHYRPHLNLGNTYLHAKAYGLAMQAFQQALALNPPYRTEIYANMGLLYLEAGQQDLARENLERALSLNPGNYVALDLLGTSYRKENNHAKAIKYYQMAIKINPKLATSSYFNLGTLYREIGEADKAVSMLTQALVLRPLWSEAYSNLGLARAEEGRYDLAVQALLKAIEINGKNHEALFNLAKVYEMTGQHEMAATTYKGLLEVAPKDVEAMHNLGIIYLKYLQNVERAKWYFSQALATDPKYEQAAAVKDVLSRTP